MKKYRLVNYEPILKCSKSVVTVVSSVCRVVAVISDFYGSERLRREKKFYQGG